MTTSSRSAPLSRKSTQVARIREFMKECMLTVDWKKKAIETAQVATDMDRQATLMKVDPEGQ